MPPLSPPSPLTILLMDSSGFGCGMAGLFSSSAIPWRSASLKPLFTHKSALGRAIPVSSLVCLSIWCVLSDIANYMDLKPCVALCSDLSVKTLTGLSAWVLSLWWSGGCGGVKQIQMILFGFSLFHFIMGLRGHVFAIFRGDLGGSNSLSYRLRSSLIVIKDCVVLDY